MIGTPRRLRLQNVTDWVDHHAVHIKCCKASILFRPCITVISGSKHPTSLTHNGMCSGEDVIVAIIKGQLGRCQTYVGKRPTVAVVSGAIDACSVSCCSGKDSSGRIDRERPNVAAVQTVVYRRPAVAIVCRFVILLLSVGSTAIDGSFAASPKILLPLASTFTW